MHCSSCGRGAGAGSCRRQGQSLRPLPDDSFKADRLLCAIRGARPGDTRRPSAAKPAPAACPGVSPAVIRRFSLLLS